MSMSKEQAEELRNELAVVCCRTEEGTIISSSNLEDPAIFPDMVDSGLLNIPDNCYKIKQVIGAKLLKTIDSLTPLTPELLEGAKEDDECNEEECKEEVIESSTTEICNDTNCTCEIKEQEGVIKIRIEEGKGIDIELPL
ncbi:sugar transporter [Hathewaya limosa]|uniref:D-proline reductase (Dithiol) PrdA n=1 Tax=Hathewaya limosa TaxID=1536 RepID=A0ABU0JP02_HATLI|nr:D-proline reductase (dithiol) PrdA [Hathewaya limosa]